MKRPGGVTGGSRRDEGGEGGSSRRRRGGWHFHPGGALCINLGLPNTSRPLPPSPPWQMTSGKGRNKAEGS